MSGDRISPPLIEDGLRKRYVELLLLARSNMSNLRAFAAGRGLGIRTGLAGAVLAICILLLIASQIRAAPSTSAAPAVQYLRAAGSKAPFSPAVRVGNVLYLSGQIGMGHDGKLPADFAQQARQTMENVRVVLQSAGSSFDDVFKCTAMLSDMTRWGEFNQIYLSYFKAERLPARSAIGVNGLAYGAMLELECVAYSPPR